jgi:hypothetical protein
MIGMRVSSIHMMIMKMKLKITPNLKNLRNPRNQNMTREVTESRKMKIWPILVPTTVVIRMEIMRVRMKDRLRIIKHNTTKSGSQDARGHETPGNNEYQGKKFDVCKVMNISEDKLPAYASIQEDLEKLTNFYNVTEE